MNQDEEISPQITLWNQQGSEVIHGTLLVIPIEEALLYIRPLYLRASGGRIPELKRVVVAYQNQIVMEETLDGALTRLFGSSPGKSLAASDTTLATAAAPANTAAPRPISRARAGLEGLDTLARQAQGHYSRAVHAQREGEWAAYGNEITQLGDVLEQLQGTDRQN